MRCADGGSACRTQLHQLVVAPAGVVVECAPREVDVDFDKRWPSHNLQTRRLCSAGDV
jgi:hypothetical protein